MTTSFNIIHAARAWMLLKNRKVTQLGFEPCLFVSGYNEYVIICHWGWDDGGQHLDGDTEYANIEFDKKLFISAFKSQYPSGLIVEETYSAYRKRVKDAIAN